MARMIPEGGPNQTASSIAEPDIYWRLANKLDDKFTVIHSLPWLCAAVKTLDKKYAQTGELDFIVLHPELGILAIEVKGGKFKYDRFQFVYLHNNQAFDPIGQIRRGTFALDAWIKKAGINSKVGYAWIFPNVDMSKQLIPPALQDVTFNTRTTIDYKDLPILDKRIIAIMKYWQEASITKHLLPQQIDQIVDLICPTAEYNLGWDARMDYDNKTWLTLNSEQIRNLKIILEHERTAISGRAGTGKTILAIALARYLAGVNQSVLFLAFNERITEKIKTELSGTRNVTILRFYQLCGRAKKRLGMTSSEEDWSETAHESLQLAIKKGKMPRYDALIIDEGQIFHREWYLILKQWINKIYVFSDEKQIFPFEVGLSNHEIEDEILDVDYANILTVNMRSPRRVFERLDISLPSLYQQSSPRESQNDTLDERISYDPLNDLFSYLGKLNHTGIPREAIGVITSKSRLEGLEKTDDALRIRQLADLDTSTRVRGLEYPFVIAFDMGIQETSLLLNAYARATTKVIAIYSIWNLRLYEDSNAEKEPFIVELMKDPVIRDAIESPWNFALAHFDWQLIQVTALSVQIYWSQSLEAWLLHTKGHGQIAEELWLNHLLLTAIYPVVRVAADRGSLQASMYTLKSRLLTDVRQHDGLQIVICDKCEGFSLKRADGTSLCGRCNSKSHTVIPPELKNSEKCDHILTNPSKYALREKTDRLGLVLLSLAAINKLQEDERKLILSHVDGRASKRIGYQPLLILTGIDILHTAPNKKITIDWLISRYTDWSGEVNRAAISNILPTCTNYWNTKKWIEKIGTGIYMRTNEIPMLID
jgi:hypothetical protein